MTTTPANYYSQCVAILTPTGRDGVLTATLLSEGNIDSVVCPDVQTVGRMVEEGIGCLLVAEEAVLNGGMTALANTLSQQPPWSDLPVLLLTRYGADSATVGSALQSFSNVTLLERPVRPATLLSALRSALKARERQYQVRAYLAEHAQTEDMLRENDRRKDEFLATLAHELRNPLAPIRNSLHILRLTNGGDPASEQVCDMIERQVGHLVRLVDDLLEVSRITRGKVELRMEPVEIAGVIRSAVEASRPLIDACDHQLAISLPSEPLTVQGDPVRLSQIFANLLNNSSKYMHSGGQIWLSVRRVDDDVLISVRDTGVGIEPEMLQHVFKMFAQVDRSKRQAQGGLGIGLTLVQSLVEMHSGTVEAKSDGLEKGSEFVIRLPLIKATQQLQQSPPAIRDLRMPKLQVLVVDDNQDAATTLSMLLQLLGCEVATANDGPSALQILKAYRPAVAFLDIGMPGMDGYEVARRIRLIPELQSVMLVALTGWGQQEDRRLSSESGFDHHMLKPADITTLKALFTSIGASTPSS
ncbi:MAG TPA: ATP-binding protein [Schlesneria sp.]|jgi:signal transduction histidine kinase/ActR/RegA family two-component response regulator